MTGARLPADCSATMIDDGPIAGRWVTFSRQSLLAPGGASFELAGERWMALHRYLPWWPRPLYGTGSPEEDGEFFLVLSERPDGRCDLAMPLVDGAVRGVLRGSPDGWSMHVPQHDPVPEALTVLLTATGEDPVELVAWAVARIAERTGTFRLRADKPTPRWVDLFGWCTWDAFRQDVTAERLLAGLADFARAGVTPRVVILDDGWQDLADEQLASFGTRADAFPHGLGPLVDAAKRDFGVEVFGVWHTLQGYWNGVHPDGDLADRYRLVPTSGEAYNMPGSGTKARCLVHPDDAPRFFDDYHRTLAAQGVDMVKVDNQASLDHFSTAEVPPTACMQAYQRALQDSTAAHFSGESLHCMSHSTDAAYSLDRAVAWRSSQDFFPSEPATHGPHVYDNAVNSVWSSTFGLCDWDMFWSDHPAAAFHAAARAISGGPVYVSDPPGQHDTALLARLVVRDGHVLRCADPALPAREGFFEDRRVVRRPTKIVNANRVPGLPEPIGVLGLFNCCAAAGEPVAVAGSYRAADVRHGPAGRSALFHYVGGHVRVVRPTDDLEIALAPLGFELVTVTPIVDGLALFGLVDLLNGSRAIRAVHRDGDDVRVDLVDGGRFGWYAERPVVAAVADGEPAERGVTGDLQWIVVPRGRDTTVTLRLATP